MNSTNINKGSFLAKVNSAGVIQWARNEFIDIDPALKMNGNRLYFTGTTRGDTCIVDNDTIFNNLNLSWVNPVIGELDLNGNLIWANRFECSANGYGASLEFDNSGNLFFCGMFGDTISINTQQLISTGFQDGFLVKMDPSGIPINVQQSFTSGGSNKTTSFMGLLRKLDGNLYLTGNFNGNTSLGPFTISPTNSDDVFVALIDENLNWLNLFHFGSATGGNLKQDSNGNLFLSLSFQNSITLGTTTLNASGSEDALIAKCSAITGQGGNERIINNQLTIYANPNKGSFRIKLPDEITNMQNAILLVFDQQGREVARFNLEESDESPRFDVNKASAGLYTVQLVQGKKTYWGKMVVE
ncbi:MAG: T9SS type A sorting domain-containing protein [Bacteroidetes bacterium]|nr:T9SS type A sorting domain-containing protein [Bacteroidota bacterium]